MQTKLSHKTANGPYIPRRPSASRAGEFVAHLITWHKHHGLTGAQAAKHIQDARA
ncbi:hypothetical protein SAMN03080615_01632 [Amphritea atlantica]|uniref:Uncharacterized protein n=1 Tax=Amphritea atlantica TaxID=355243 RepID=A0A1H9GE92_9GAMM|nr:hypothetical protein SAMN03080615_01632 [Amphritea atlantica]